MKSILTGLCLLAFAVLDAAAGDSLLKYIPAGTEYVVSVDVAALRQLPLFRTLAESDNPDVKAYRETFERDYSLRLDDCTELLFAGGGKRLRGLLAATQVPEQELAARLQRHGERFSVSAEQGRRLYCLMSTESIPSRRRTIAATYLEPQTVLATEREYVAPFLAGLAAPAVSRARLAQAPAGDPPAWSFINVEALNAGKKKKKNDLSGMILNGIRTIALTFDVTGGGTGWRLAGDALCTDPGSAQLVAMQLPIYLQFGASLLFSDDPALGAEFLKQVKITPDQDRVRFELNVSQPLGERLKSYLESQAKKRVIPPDPVPGQAPPSDSAGGRRR